MGNNAFEYLSRRGVNRICHFTRAVSLLHIFHSKEGILATAFLKDYSKRQNDLKRLDNQADYINCSIQYPNTWYLQKIRDKDSIFKDWVILFIDLEILKHRELKFSPCNAATGNGFYISSKFDCLLQMFKNELSIGQRKLRRETSMLSCCPTDDQSEILIYQNIPLIYIIGIGVPDENSASDVDARFKTIDIQEYPPLYIAPEIFDTSWSRKIRQGDRPLEEMWKQVK